MSGAPDPNGERTDQGDAPRRSRSRYASSEPDGRLPRIFILAAAVLLAGAAIMFWPRGGGDIPTGIGERITVVAEDDSQTADVTTPRSGDVEISQQQAELVPEPPQRSASSESQARGRESSAPPAGGEAGSTTRRAARTAQPPERIVPSDDGPWAVQVGAFGNEDNAHALVARLIGLGYPARMRAASTSGGDIVYRVWIGYFASRNAAASFARQHRDQIGDANPVHR